MNDKEKTNMRPLKQILSGMLLISFLSTPAFAQDAQDILKKADDKLFPKSYESYRKIINEEPDGKKKEFVFFTVKKGANTVALVYLSPASDKGRSVLRIGGDVWLYIPNVGKPIRSTSMQSITGGIFNNADIMALDYDVEYQASFLEQGEQEDLLQLKAKTKTVAYDSVKMWLTKDTLLVRKIECYSASNMLIKTLEFKEMKDFGNGLVRPSVIETTSPLSKGYRSIMIYAGIKAREFPDEVFTLNYLPKLENLRE